MVSPLTGRVRFAWTLAVVSLIWVAEPVFAQSPSGLPLASRSPAPAGRDEILDYLRRRVIERPEDAQAWRMLGKSLAERGDPESAREALERALTLEPTNAAAHYDLGRLLEKEGEAQSAANHLARVTSLVPESEYAAEARRLLETLPVPTEDESFVLASYEIKRFDGSELTNDLEVDALRAIEPRDPLSMRIETGVLYNTNVALSPTNRNFVADGAGSPQVVFNPSAEYRIVNTDDWRAGPLGTGYFTINNGEFSDLNLQSYLGGLFVERSLPVDGATLVPRLQYAYTLDQFAGSTFGRRHAVAASLTSVWDNLDTTVAYYSVDSTNLKSDGGNPSITSQDGVTQAVGIAHTWWLDRREIRSATLGVDGQRADLEGSDFAFDAAFVYGAAVFPLTDILTLTLEGGGGYRDYYAAPSPPSRNQTILRGSSRLELALTEHWTVAGVFSAERLDSAEETLRTSRLIGGVLAIYQY